MVKRYTPSYGNAFAASENGIMVSHKDYAELRALCDELAEIARCCTTTKDRRQVLRDALAKYDQWRQDNYGDVYWVSELIDKAIAEAEQV